jgi:hypothetical protein
MFDLEEAIAEWRRQMLAAGIKAPVPLEELEIHLREEIEGQVKSGLHEQEAFNFAVNKIGQAFELKAEFAKINKMEEKVSMKNSRIVSNMSLVIVLLATVWLVYSASMIGKRLFPQDGLVSLRASDGATVQIQHGILTLQGEGVNYGPGLTLQGEGVNYGPGEYNVALIPALAIPFAILVAFAVLGCRSLFRKQTTLAAQR